MQDTTLVHTARLTTAWLAEKGIYVRDANNQGKALLRETSVGEARRHVCAVGVRVARLALASALYTTRSLRSCKEATIRFCIRAVLALVSSTLSHSYSTQSRIL
jgi:hypothetical protein